MDLTVIPISTTHVAVAQLPLPVIETKLNSTNRTTTSPQVNSSHVQVTIKECCNERFCKFGKMNLHKFLFDFKLLGCCSYMLCIYNLNGGLNIRKFSNINLQKVLYDFKFFGCYSELFRCRHISNW